MSKKVGEIYYEVTLDTSKLIEGQREVSSEVGKASAKLGGMDAALQSTAKNATGAAASLTEVAKASKIAAASTGIAQKSFDDAGISAGQMKAAMRTLPAQFTDIFTSLQGGQDPLTVFIQQGGQIKDQFGGAGVALRAMAGYIAGLVNPYTVAAAAAGVFIYGLVAGGKEMERFSAGLELTGNRTGTTTDQLVYMAEQLDNLAGVTQGQVSEALNEFIALGIKGSASVAKFTEAAIRLEREAGISIQETAKQFKELEKDPLKAAVKLDEKVGFLTLSLYEQIKALDAQGRKIEAATLAQNAYADAIEQRTGGINENLGTIERSWRAITSAARDALDAIKNIGREDSAEGKIAKLNQEIAALQSALASTANENRPLVQAQGKKDLANKIAERDTLLETLRLSKMVASAQATERARVDAQVAKDAKKPDKPKAPTRERIPFDSEAYMAGLSARAADEWDRVAIVEQEALRKNAELLMKQDITQQQFEDARTLIQQNAQAARQELMRKDTEAYLQEMNRRHQQETQQAAMLEQNRAKAKAAMGEADPVEAIRTKAQAEIDVMESFRQLDLENEQLYQDAKYAIKAKAEADIEALQQRTLQNQLASASAGFGSLADVAKSFSGEQSGIYRALFAASKGFAIAESIVKIQQGIASAAALPFPSNIPAMATVAAQTASIVSTIKSTNIQGARQYGGPVSAGGLYRVNETGRPELYTAGDGRQYMLPTKQGRVTAADNVGMGGVQWSIVVNNSAPGAVASASVDEQSRTVTIAVAEVASQIRSNTGQVWSAMRAATNVQSRL